MQSPIPDSHDEWAGQQTTFCHWQESQFEDGVALGTASAIAFVLVPAYPNELTLIMRSPLEEIELLSEREASNKPALLPPLADIT